MTGAAFTPAFTPGWPSRPASGTCSRPARTSIPRPVSPEACRSATETMGQYGRWRRSLLYRARCRRDLPHYVPWLHGGALERSQQSPARDRAAWLRQRQLLAYPKPDTPRADVDLGFTFGGPTTPAPRASANTVGRPVWALNMPSATTSSWAWSTTSFTSMSMSACLRPRRSSRSTATSTCKPSWPASASNSARARKSSGQVRAARNACNPSCLVFAQPLSSRARDLGAAYSCLRLVCSLVL